MNYSIRFSNLISPTNWRAAMVALEIAFVLTLAATQPAQAQTFTVLHNFTGGQDGAGPVAGVTMDGAGNLYGTTDGGGGRSGAGAVYKLTHRGSGWIVNPLYNFTGGSDGANPEARVIFGPNGTLYGTTVAGGEYNDGTVFNLRPFPTVCKAALCPWMETVLYSFTGGVDGDWPYLGDVIFDQAGNLYGTTANGGANGGGVVYELTPPGGWGTESVLHAFGSSGDGTHPDHGVVFDNHGNLYGTTWGGGSTYVGLVFQLVPVTGGWTENILYSFENGNDGGDPMANVIADQSGNLYGATDNGGTGGGGTVFELSPSGDSWTYNLLYSFAGIPGGSCGPWGTLTMDEAGNLYGTTYCDGSYGFGNVFKLSPSNGGWTYTSLHDFCAGGLPCSDGNYPWSTVVFDSSGNLYGTASEGGSFALGVVWEITP